MKIFNKQNINLLYWILNKPFGIIAIRSYTFQKWNKIKNFNIGDDLNFYMLRKLTGKRIINYNDMRKPRFNITHYTCIGSVFEWEVDSASIVWGTGSMYGGLKQFIKPQKICAVRGPLTRKALINQGIPCPEVYGDPALLLPLVYKPHVNKKYKIGLIPHYVDCNLSSVKSFCNKYENKILLIHMQNYNNWKEVVDDICSCECTASSSLHGMIISDAYNIPNVWIRLSDNIAGGDFKYLDYLASVERVETTPVDFRNKDISIECLKMKLKGYHHIMIDISALIQSCPFINERRRKELLNDVPKSYPFLSGSN